MAASLVEIETTSSQSATVMSNETSSETPLLETLQLSPSSRFHQPDLPVREPSDGSAEVTCLFCQCQFDISDSRDDFLRHLVLQHRLVIADFRHILDFKGYVEYWRQRFKTKPITEFCCVIQTNSKDTDPEPSELYYLLCDALPEDKTLRHQLQKQRLKEVLTQQQEERRSTTFSHGCLFCREHFSGQRADLFNHLSSDHNFNVGHPDNLVYTDDLLHHLQNKLERLQCLYCEKTFKDRHVLKEHMRKKQHKKINPKNTDYDKYYIINYLEFGKNWEEIQSEDDKELGDDEVSRNDDWDDWQENGDEVSLAVCLFCPKSDSAKNIMDHVKLEHGFDFLDISSKLKLSFYEQVKLVNFIRRQIHQTRCIGCGDEFEGRAALLQHLQESRHGAALPSKEEWDRPEYFFPTYEDDNLLCALEDYEDNPTVRGSGSPHEASIVIAEDLPVLDEEVKRLVREEFSQ